MILPAGNDPETVKPGGQVETWIQSTGQLVQIYEFPEMRHGWVPRGNVEMPAVARDVQLALQKTVEFLKTHM